MKIDLDFSFSEMSEFLTKNGYSFDMVSNISYNKLSEETYTSFETIAYKSNEDNPINLGIRSDILVEKYGIKTQFEKEIKLKLLKLN